MTYNSMTDVRRANANRGHHWFDPETLQFFRSRVGRTLYGGRYFISSEQNKGYYPEYYCYPRMYTVRVVNADGSIDTVGEFQAYETRAQAIAAIKRLLREG
jgi:hypothetical protein